MPAADLNGTVHPPVCDGSPDIPAGRDQLFRVLPFPVFYTQKDDAKNQKYQADPAEDHAEKQALLQSQGQHDSQYHKQRPQDRIHQTNDPQGADAPLW